MKAVLDTRRDTLKETMAKYRSPLSPIHRMPPETLVHIFSFYCERNFLSPYLLPQVMALSAVCGRWREVALAIPRLWSSMSIDLGDWYAGSHASGESNRDSFCRLIETFMERTKRETLDLRINEFFHVACIPLEAGLCRLLNHSNRWRSLTFSGYCSPLSEEPSPFRHLGGCLSNLQHVSLNFRGASEESSTSDVALFNECPLLNSLDIINDYFHWRTTLTYNFPWSQIQSLKISGWYSAHMMQIMVSCTNVQQMEVKCVTGSASLKPSPTITTLTELHHMSIEDWSDHPFFLFQSLTLPSLSSLDIRGSWVSTSNSFAQFLLRSSSSITSLSLNSRRISDSQTLDLLTLIPTLTKLCIEEEGGQSHQPENRVVTQMFLEKLVGDKSSCSFLPQLADLTFTVFPLKPSTRQALGRALASRLPTLRTFALVVFVSRELGRWEPDLSDYDSLWCFRDAGMRIHRSFKKSILF